MNFPITKRLLGRHDRREGRNVEGLKYQSPGDDLFISHWLYCMTTLQYNIMQCIDHEHSDVFMQ